MNKKIKPSLLVITVIGLIVLLSACGGAGESDFPTGKFISPSSVDQAYVFNSDGTWQFLAFGGIGAESTYTVKGDQITLDGTEDCPNPAMYAWSFDGTVLSFTLVGGK